MNPPHDIGLGCQRAKPRKRIARLAAIIGMLAASTWTQAPATAFAQDDQPKDQTRADPVSDPDGLRKEALFFLLDSLRRAPVPRPDRLSDFVKDERAAVALGKALFWDQQAGSDGMACASCHFHAGADSRAKNQVSPGLIGGNNTFDRLPSGRAAAGPNQTLGRSDFPLHRKADPRSHALGPNVLFDTDDVISSSGVAHLGLRSLGTELVTPRSWPSVTQDLVTIRANLGAGIVPRSAFNVTIVPNATRRQSRAAVAESFSAVQADPLGFSIAAGGRRLNVRRVEPRNSPTVINAIFNHRNFWDGRANFHFNGRNPFGARDPDARVWRFSGSKLEPVAILLDNASLASQAVGPAESVMEMAAHHRNFLHLGRKLLLTTPLLQQTVAATDSALGPYARSTAAAPRTGLKVGYTDLIKRAFDERWWGAPGEPLVIDGVAYAQIEANFSLFWGIAIMLYERTLVSDAAPFDRFMDGDTAALTPQQRVGLSLFLHEGRCTVCHAGPVLTSASIAALAAATRGRDGNARNDVGAPLQLLERMPTPQGPIVYDTGFYNVGVRPAFEDQGIGGRDAFGNPLSFSAQATGAGRIVDAVLPFANPAAFESGVGVPPLPGEPIGVAGAFKTPTLRNVDLTGPYFHNGGLLTLEQVVEFYARGSDFVDWNTANGVTTPIDIAPVPALIGNRDNIRAVAAFLRALTDPRVAYERAPFDHPSLSVPNGHAAAMDPTLPGVARSEIIVKPAVGAAGLAQPIEPFLGGSLVAPDGVPRDDGLR